MLVGATCAAASTATVAACVTRRGYGGADGLGRGLYDVGRPEEHVYDAVCSGDGALAIGIGPGTRIEVRSVDNGSRVNVFTVPGSLVSNVAVDARRGL